MLARLFSFPIMGPISGSTWGFVVFGRLSAMAVGSLLSPGWWLMKHVLSPYLLQEHWQNASEIQASLSHFYAFLHTHPHVVALTLLPQLTLCLFVSLAYLILCDLAGKKIGLWLMGCYTRTDT